MKRYLLDTHVLLWALTRDRRLGRAARTILDEEPVYVSAVSIWELLSKHGKRLRLPEGRLIDRVTEAGATLIALKAEHAEEACGLNAMHADPFDRMLVATARIEHMTLMTRDADILALAAPLLGPLLLEV